MERPAAVRLSALLANFDCRFRRCDSAAELDHGELVVGVLNDSFDGASSRSRSSMPNSMPRSHFREELVLVTRGDE